MVYLHKIGLEVRKWCPSLHYPSNPHGPFFCLTGHDWSLTQLAKIYGEHCTGIYMYSVLHNEALFRVYMELVSFRKNSIHCYLLCGNEVQWNLVSTDTKGTCHGVLIIWVSVLSRLSVKKLHRHMLYWYKDLGRQRGRGVGTMTDCPTNPILIANPESWPTCDRCMKNPDFYIHSDIFVQLSQQLR